MLNYQYQPQLTERWMLVNCPKKKVFMDEMEQIDSDGQEQSGGLYVHRPSLGFQSHGNLEKDKHVTQAHRFTNRLKSRRKSPHQ